MATQKGATAPKTDSKTKDESPRDKFLRVAGTRVANAISKIDLLANIGSNRYEYTEADMEKAFAAIDAAVISARTSWRKGLEKKEKGSKDKTPFDFN